MNPFASIWEDRPSASVSTPTTIKAVTKAKKDHTEARKIYDAYLIKVAELKKQQDYAQRIVKATSGSGQTLVMPLATMGTNGNCLRCDYCDKPIILEGGKYNKVPVDVAWKENSDPLSTKEKWRSWIKGGMVVSIVDNGTLRIYHGYSINPTDCCSIAEKQHQDAYAIYKRDKSKDKLIVDFLKDEMPNKLNEMLTNIVKVLFSYDPGIGINRC